MNNKTDLTFPSGQAGFSDETLEQLSKPQPLFDSGIAPWVNWESENSSFGKTFRKWAKYPSILPLYICSDHGVHLGSRCWPNETQNKCGVFFSWNKKKSEKMEKVHDKASYHVPHPWVFYRKKYYPSLPEERAGTLVFYAHSNDRVTPVYHDFDEYINNLKSLPNKYQPISICLSFHDIKKGVHKELRKYGIPLVTAGTTRSKHFVDRFYSLVYRYKFSTSPNIGSHTFYLLEAGIPFFLYGQHPKLKVKENHYIQGGGPNFNNYGDEEDFLEYSKLRELLTPLSEEVTLLQYTMVSKFLGMDSGMPRFKASLILWRAFFCSGELIKNFRLFSRYALKFIFRRLKSYMLLI